MSNQNNDRIDTLEEVTEQLTQHSKRQDDRITNVEKNINNYPKVYLPDYAPQFEQISLQLNDLIKQQPASKGEFAADQLDKKLDKLLKSSPERIKLKMLLVYFGLVIITAISFGFAVALKAQVNTVMELLQQQSVNTTKAPVAQSQDTEKTTVKAPTKHRKVRQRHLLIHQ